MGNDERRAEYEFPTDVINEALRRAKYVCERCHKQKRLYYHHKLPIGIAVNRFPDLLPEIVKSLANISCLCKECHAIEDKESRKEKNYLPQYLELKVLSQALQSELHATSLRKRR